MMTNKTVCIDLDGTLIHYEEWQGEEHFGHLLPGASDATKILHEKGWYIIIYTTRANKSILTKSFNVASGFCFVIKMQLIHLGAIVFQYSSE